MDKVQIFEVIKEIMINELSFAGNTISKDTALRDMGIDSIQLMTLVVYIEEKLEMEINFDESWPIEITSITLDEFINRLGEML